MSEDYQIIASYLLEEGYVESYKSAESMVNAMSKEWFNEVAIRTGYFDYKKGKLDSGYSPRDKVERKIQSLGLGKTLKDRKRANKLTTINFDKSGYSADEDRKSGLRNAANSIQEPIRPLGKKR